MDAGPHRLQRGHWLGIIKEKLMAAIFFYIEMVRLKGCLNLPMLLLVKATKYRGNLKFGYSLNKASSVKPWKLQGNQCHHPMPSKGNPYWVPEPLVLAMAALLLYKTPWKVGHHVPPSGFLSFPIITFIFCKSHNSFRPNGCDYHSNVISFHWYLLPYH